MSKRVEDRYPVRGWWKREGLMLSEFLATLEHFRQLSYTYDEFEYTHDVFVNDVPVGEAAMVEQIDQQGTIVAFLAIGKLSPTYGVIDPRFGIREKTDP